MGNIIEDPNLNKQPNLTNLLARGTMSGAFAGSISAGFIAFCMAIFYLLFFGHGDISKFSTAELLLFFLYVCGFVCVIGGLVGLVPGTFMGILVGMIDSRFKLNLSNSSRNAGFWIFVGIILGAFGGAMFLGIPVMIGPPMIIPASLPGIVGFVFGGISGVMAGPIFRHFYEN